MSELSPAERLMAHARSLLRTGDTLAFATDTTSYAGRHVLLALVRPGGVDVVLSIRASEWDALKALPILGFESERVPAMERARRAMQQAPAKTPKTTRTTKTRRTT
jgi:hypothetical protein